MDTTVSWPGLSHGYWSWNKQTGCFLTLRLHWSVAAAWEAVRATCLMIYCAVFATHQLLWAWIAFLLSVFVSTPGISPVSEKLISLCSFWGKNTQNSSYDHKVYLWLSFENGICVCQLYVWYVKVAVVGVAKFMWETYKCILHIKKWKQNANWPLFKSI